ncbi:MAG: PEGA domain-containing protein [Proteobacteria bacterium]|nr:PEGA domain-containing protein [Pseudomonadota bacterium]
MVIRSRTFRSLAALASALMVMMPALSPAAQAARSVAVQPVADGDSDEASREIAAEIGDALKATTPHHVIDSKLAAEVSSYQGALPQPFPEAAALVSAAKEHYFNFKYDDANRSLERAISMLAPYSAAAGVAPLILEAHIIRAMVANSRAKKDAATSALNDALAVDPLLTLAAADYPPSLVSLLDDLRSAAGRADTGSIAVVSVPEGADVLINGISRGRAPLELEGLPAGTYSLAVLANRYAAFEKSVAVEPGGRAEVKARLRWAKGKAGSDRASRAADGAAAVREGVRMADALSADRVVLIDADSGAGGRMDVIARTVDRDLKAGAAPVMVRGVDPDSHSGLIAELVKGIAGQVDLDLASDPRAFVDPIGEADAKILAKRKKPLTRQPLFWGAIGAAAAGAIVGGILAAMGGGSSTGDIRVNFR